MDIDAAKVKYQKNLALKAVMGLPEEDTLYGIAGNFLSLHQHLPHCFTIYPQLSLKWKPDESSDQCSEIPDIDIGKFYTSRGISSLQVALWCGGEMGFRHHDFSPTPILIHHNYEVRAQFHSLMHQTQNQAKVAYKNHYPSLTNGVQWIFMVGPYWKLEVLGPFMEAQMAVWVSCCDMLCITPHSFYSFTYHIKPIFTCH